MSAVYFLLLLGGLIFFHELGHFLAARAMGVHVVTFSIGFGPTLLRFHGRPRGPWGPTEYVIAALPLGGYVRMLGDDPAEDLPEISRPVSFGAKSIWRRLLIVAAGPAFNLILPYFIFFGAGLMAHELTPSVVGMLDESGSAAAAGIEPGDRVVEVNGAEVRYFWQLQEHFGGGPGRTLDVVVDRPSSGRVSVSLTPAVHQERVLPGIEVFEELGRVGIVPACARW